MNKFLILVAFFLATVSLLWYVNTRAVSKNYAVNFGEFKKCVNICQNNFCTVNIENVVDCPDRGFASCQHDCQLKFR